MTIPFIGLDLTELIIGLGYVGIFAVVWAESGFFLGAALPGDSLLFLLGVLASQGIFNIYLLIVILTTAAILGDNFGYWFGKTVGPKLFTREDSRFFKKSYLERTNRFYERYGAKTIVLARFIPVVRTFAPIVAGACGMNHQTFLRYNILGAFLWVLSLTLAGYFLGKLFPDGKEALLLIISGIVFLSIIPILVDVLKKVKKKGRAP